MAAWVRKADREILIQTTAADAATGVIQAPAGLAEPGDMVEFTPLETPDTLLDVESARVIARVSLHRKNQWLPLKRTAVGWRAAREGDAPALQPGEGMLLEVRQRAGDTLWFAGELRSSPVLRWIPHGGKAFVGGLLGAPELLEEFAGSILPEWRPAAGRNSLDSLRLWRDGRFVWAVFDGTRWRVPGSKETTITLPSARPVVIERRVR